MSLNSEFLTLPIDFTRSFRDDVDDAGESVGPVDRRGGPVNHLDALDVADRILPRDIGDVRPQVVLLDAVDEEEGAVGGVGAKAALIDVGIGSPAAARDVETGEVVEHLLQIVVPAALDLL